MLLILKKHTTELFQEITDFTLLTVLKNPTEWTFTIPCTLSCISQFFKLQAFPLLFAAIMYLKLTINKVPVN